MITPLDLKILEKKQQLGIDEKEKERADSDQRLTREINKEFRGSTGSVSGVLRERWENQQGDKPENNQG